MFTLALLLLLGANPTPAEAKGETCGARTCTAPEKSITVTGMKRGSSRQECWIQCVDGKTCPEGLSCVMKHDGPGHVCVKPSP